MGRKQGKRVFKRGKSWSFTYYIQDGENGKKQRRTKGGFPTKKDAVFEKRKIEAAIRLGMFQDYTMTCSQYFNYYLENIRKPTLSYNTYMSFRNCLKNYINPIIGKKPMISVERSDIQELYDVAALRSEKVLIILKPFVNQGYDSAVQQSLLPYNPAANIRLKRKHPSKPKVPDTLSDGQIEKLLSAIQDSPIFIDLLLGISLGLRKSEIRGLKYTDINFRARQICILRTLGKTVESEKLSFGQKTKQPQFTKTTCSNRIVSVPQSVLHELEKHRNRYEENRMIYGASFLDEEYVCCQDNGQPRSTSYYSKPLKALAEKTGLEKLTLGLLRKSFATSMFNNGADLEEVSRKLGHTNIIMTADYYLNRSGRVEAASDKLQDYISSIGLAP